MVPEGRVAQAEWTCPDWVCIDAAGALLGEGALWDDRTATLWWVDIKRSRIHRWRDGAALPVIEGGRVTALALANAGGLVALGDHGLAALDDAGRPLDALSHPERGHPRNRWNDAKVAPDGALWAGSMDDGEEEASGALWRLTADGGAARIAEDYAVTNGPTFSPDGRWMYHADSGRQRIWRYDLSDPAFPREPWARFGDGQGYPDGMTTDAEGCVWVAFWDGWCVRRLTPDGAIDREVRVPVARPTCPAFGGDGFRTLFVTSASVGLDAAALAGQPQAGGLFAADVGVSGMPAHRFG